MALTERIYELPDGTAVTDTSNFPNEDSANANITEKLTGLKVKNYVLGGITDSNNNTNVGSGNGSTNLSNNGTFTTMYGVQNLKSGVATAPFDANVAIGNFNLRKFESGESNTTIGFNNLDDLVTGNYNFAAGYENLLSLVSGSYNISIGTFGTTGNAYTGAESGNILIGGATGTLGENYVTRIGWVNGSATQTAFYADGIYTVDSSGLTAGRSVFIGSDGRIAASTLTYAALSTAQTFTAAQAAAYVTLTDAATIAIDSSLANNFKVTLGGNRTLGVPTNMGEGRSGVIDVRQDITGTRTLAYSWVYEFEGGSAPILSTPALSSDRLNYSIDYYSTSTVTVTIATPGVMTWTAHGLVSGQKLQLTTTGALPTGLAIDTTYWVTVIDANTFNLSSSLANARTATFIATSGTQSGVHTAVACSIFIAPNYGIA